MSPCLRDPCSHHNYFVQSAPRVRYLAPNSCYNKPRGCRNTALSVRYSPVLPLFSCLQMTVDSWAGVDAHLVVPVSSLPISGRSFVQLCQHLLPPTLSFYGARIIRRAPRPSLALWIRKFSKRIIKLVGQLLFILSRWGSSCLSILPQQSE